MDQLTEITSLMDVFDFDEDFIDTRLKNIMDRSTFETKHLTNAINLLNYKYMINLQEGTDCPNDEEYNFIVKLIKNVNSYNIHQVCRILTIVLNLNPTNFLSQAEHLLQQFLSNVSVPSNSEENNLESEITLLQFKICDCILEVIINAGERVSLLFFEEPIENIINSSNEKVKMHFISVTAPKLFYGIQGYNIMDRIWSYIKNKTHDVSISLKTLSCLADFYLPAASRQNNVISSDIIFSSEFWRIILNGLSSHDHSLRKLSIYLAKRAIDCVIVYKKDFKVENKSEIIFKWSMKHEEELKWKWHNFFILMDSLEEKQSNIVLPSLQIFKSIDDIGSCWLNCAFNIGLKHDNTEVKLKCIENRLKYEIKNCNEAIVILNSLNDLNLYSNITDIDMVLSQVSNNLNFAASLASILEAIPMIKWSPVPLFHLSEVVRKHKCYRKLTDFQFINEITKVPCNIVPIRNAIANNFLSFIANNIGEAYHWRDVIFIFTMFQLENVSQQNYQQNQLFKNIKVPDEEKPEFYKAISVHENINFCLLFFALHPQDVAVFGCEIDNKLGKIEEIVSRQYSNVTDCLKEAIFTMELFCKVNNFKFRNIIMQQIYKKYSTIIKLIFRLLTDDLEVSISDNFLLFQGFKAMSNFMSIENDEFKVMKLELYKSALLLLKHNDTAVPKKVMAMYVINSHNGSLLSVFPHEMLEINNLLDLIINLKCKEAENIKKDYTGRQWNVLYEKSSELIYEIINYNENIKNLAKIINFIEYIVDCGGHGCLKWILRLLNKILPWIGKEGKNTKFDVTSFINRMWKEIDELKSNNQYSICMEEFVNLITQEALLKNPNYNNVIILYCSKIIEYGDLKLTPVSFMVKRLNNLNVCYYDHMVYVLSEILLFSPVPRKDQRIIDSVVLRILCDPKYLVHENIVEYTFQFQIQYQALEVLCKITDQQIFTTLEKLIMKKIDNIFKNKQRYHGNSQLHRVMLSALQTLMLIFVLKLNKEKDSEIVGWCLELLGRMPHEPSIRICLEWYIALSFYCKNTVLNDGFLVTLKKYNTPLNSQFSILFWLLKHKISKTDYTEEEYDFVMNVFFSHTMGQMFNIRLYAQYLAIELYSLKKSEKFSYIIQIIDKTLQENSEDKNFIKLKEDFMFNGFDIITHLNPVLIIYFIPKYFCISGFENCNINYLKPVNKLLIETISKREENKFCKEWIESKRDDEQLFEVLVRKLKTLFVKKEQDGEATGTIQKKYVPWKNMSDIDSYRTENKKVTKSELIVVASLIDRIPNLGGMARSSEVFAVNTYIVSSLRCLQDKQFQGLSVSAERWINIEEVRPGAPLKDYLTTKKMEGYSIVAAEQTSSSSPLHRFKFPKKCVLLLGHEKEGIPCDLLPMMDHCVEVPQKGVIRSLNVHVTAAIFVWEYNKQHVVT